MSFEVLCYRAIRLNGAATDQTRGSSATALAKPSLKTDKRRQFFQQFRDTSVQRGYDGDHQFEIKNGNDDECKRHMKWEVGLRGPVYKTPQWERGKLRD